MYTKLAPDGRFRRIRHCERSDQSGHSREARAIPPLPEPARAGTQRQDEYGRADAHRSRTGAGREGSGDAASAAEGKAMNPHGPERRSQEALWDVRDVARFLKASVSWVYKAAERGELPCIRVG